jgi:hypothetical protein
LPTNGNQKGGTTKMKITIEPTDRMIDINNGTPARIWEGKTEKGISCILAVTRIAVHDSQDTAEFERDLQEQRAPSENAIRCWPLRMIL